MIPLTCGRLILPVILSTFLSASWTEMRADQNAREVLENVRKKYDSIKDAEITFSQHVWFERTSLEQRASGTLRMKKGNKYRVEMNDQTVVTNGTTVWSYSSVTQQVIIDEYSADARGLSPETILTGAPEDFDATVVGQEAYQGKELLVVKMTPKDEQSMLTSLKLWIDESTWLIRKADLEDAGGKRTEYSISDLRTNTGLDDGLFTFAIPEGVEVVDLR